MYGDLPRWRSKFWVGAIDRPTLFGQATAQRASRPTRPTDPLRAAGGTKYDSDHPTDRPSLKVAGDAKTKINFAPPCNDFQLRCFLATGSYTALPNHKLVCRHAPLYADCRMQCVHCGLPLRGIYAGTVSTSPTYRCFSLNACRVDETQNGSKRCDGSSCSRLWSPTI